MKLIIDIPEKEYKHIKWKANMVTNVEWWEYAINNGKPLNEVLDEIRVEIMDFEEELFHRPNTDYTDYAAVRHCVEIIDKYREEQE